MSDSDGGRRAKDSLDFLVIGAEKAGTTALFSYMWQHPELYLPYQKEINFFADEDRFDRGVSWYMETYFSGADESKLWGEASPQYMGYTRAPARIKAAFPEIKLVSVLRNPIDRAYSHYRMAARRGTETRPFTEVVAERLEYLSEPPRSGGEDDSPYLLNFSLYGKTLERYLQYFDREQILVLFQEDLLNDPRAVLAGLFAFLGVDTAYVPPNLGKKYHVGGTQRIPGLRGWIQRQTVLKKVARKALLSERNVEVVKFWIEVLNVKPVEDEGLSSDERRFLREIFREDVALLRRTFSIATPWADFEHPEKFS